MATRRSSASPAGAGAAVRSATGVRGASGTGRHRDAQVEQLEQPPGAMRVRMLVEDALARAPPHLLRLPRVGEPSRRLPHVDFALGGEDFRGDIGRARLVGNVPINVFAQAISAARINLNVTRRAHATVYASSTSRPFELAMSGATIVSNPHEGIERWLEPGRELLVVSTADEAVDAYRDLLDDPTRAEEMGRAARERALDEHTYLHRARRVLELLEIRTPEAVVG